MFGKTEKSNEIASFGGKCFESWLSLTLTTTQMSVQQHSGARIS